MTRNSIQSSPTTEASAYENILNSDPFNLKVTLSRQQVKTLAEKYPFIFKGNGLTESHLDGLQSLVALTNAVKFAFGFALVQYGSLSEAEVGYESLLKEAVILGVCRVLTFLLLLLR